MKSRTLQFLSALGACLALLGSAAAEAAAFRTYLSRTGNDANPCTLQQPCRLLPAAIAAANDGGEVWMLDSANFNTGPVLINKGIKVLAIPGEVGSVVGNGGDALVINAPGKDVTLRNLVVLNLAGGINGINIQDAGAVHIEKTTVHDFTDPSGACIRYTNSTSTRIFVDDSFLRQCSTAIFATSLALPAGTRPSVILDNTRIERLAVGIRQQGCVDVILRNSSMTRQDFGVVVDSLVADCDAVLHVFGSQITRVTNGIVVTANTPNAGLRGSIVSSQMGGGQNAIAVTNSANGTGITFDISDSYITFCGNNCVTATNNATDAVDGVQFNITRSSITHAFNDLLNFNAPGGGRLRAWIRDSTLSHSTRVLKTAGATGFLQVSFVRSNMHASTYIVDHGFGSVRLDGCHMTNVANTFVNSGSGDVTSLSNNWLTNFTNTTPGFVYITPAIIAPI